MPLVTPAQCNFYSAQNYSEIIFAYSPNMRISLSTLAPATNSGGYLSGCIVAQYTAGSLIGKFVNYNPSGIDGQNVAVGIIADDYLDATVTVNGGYANIVFGAAELYTQYLYWTTPGAGDNLTTIMGTGASQIPSEFIGGVLPGTLPQTVRLY